MYNTRNSADVSLAGITAQQNVQLAGFTTQQIIAAQNDATQVAMAGFAASVDIAKTQAIASLYTAPYQAESDFYKALASGGTDSQGRNGLVQLLYGAEGTKGSELILPGGVMAGRVGSAGGNLFGSTFNSSSFGTTVSQIFGALSAPMGGGGYGFQTGGNSFGAALLGVI